MQAAAGETQKNVSSQLPAAEISALLGLNCSAPLLGMPDRILTRSQNFPICMKQADQVS